MSRLAKRMQQRRGVSEQWELLNPILADGEIGWDKTNNIVKIGDGVTAWNELKAFMNGGISAQNAVTLDDEQTISGTKTFITRIYVNPNQDGTRKGVELRSNSIASLISLTSYDQTKSFTITSNNEVLIRDESTNKVLGELTFPEQTGTLATVSDVETAKTEAVQTALQEFNNGMEVVFSLTADGLLHVEEKEL